MDHRIGKDHLRSAVELAMNSQERGDRCWICEGYDVRGDEIVSRYAPPFGEGEESDHKDAFDPGRWTWYRPLSERPELFISLARLHDEDDFIEAALAFVHRYGVPGDMDIWSWSRGSHFRKYHWLSREFPRQSVSRVEIDLFRREARYAWCTLRLYEAALNGDAATVVEISQENTDWVEEVFNAVVESLQPGPVYYASKTRASEVVAEEIYLDYLDLETALEIAIYQVVIYVKALCSPGIFLQRSPRTNDGNRTQVTASWDFECLLGAAYLQMYWLMTSDENLARCDFCGRIISRGRPNPQGRKPRNDKRYCDDACRQNHHREKRKARQSD